MSSFSFRGADFVYVQNKRSGYCEACYINRDARVYVPCRRGSICKEENVKTEWALFCMHCTDIKGRPTIDAMEAVFGYLSDDDDNSL